MSRAPRRWGASGALASVAATAVLVLTGLVPAGTAAAAATGWVVRPLCATPRPGHASCHGLRLVRGRVLAGARSVQRPASGGGPAGGYSPWRLAKAYGLDPNAKIAATQTVAVVDAYDDPSVRRDLAAFDRKYGLPKETAASFRVVNQRGRTSRLPEPDEGWAGEIGLDVQTVRGICHKCRILLVEADSDSDSDLAAGVNRAATMGATEISNSYGGTEADPMNTRRVVAAYDHAGIVITASTGDGGWYDWDYANEGQSLSNTPEIPAAYQTVVGVGGTSLLVDSSGRRLGERVWNGDGPADQDGGSQHQALGAAGGGCSTVYAARLWQLKVRGYSALGCGLRRSSVDVAAVADPATGFDVYQTFPQGVGSWATAGGTSLASPLIAAAWATAGGSGGVRYPALSLYGHFASDPTRPTHDIVSGGNGLCGGVSVPACQTAWGANPNVAEGGLADCAFAATGTTVQANRYQCNARAGYDGVAGVGTPAGVRVFKATGPHVHVVWPARPRAGVRQAYSVRTFDPFPGGHVVHYTWHWGDGTVTHATQPGVTHRYRRAGRVTVTVRVGDNYASDTTITRHWRVAV